MKEGAMKKVKLDLDAIQVDTFEVTQTPSGRGTVQGHVCCACCGCDPCCCTCCDTCAATCAASCQSCQTCLDSCWGTCVDPTCAGRSCDICFSDACYTYQQPYNLDLQAAIICY
jgi:hypothetical protein